MALAVVQTLYLKIPEEVRAHTKVVTAALLVAAAVYLVWGKIALLCYFGGTAIAYSYLGSSVRVFEKLDLKGLTLAGFVLVAPLFGGVLAYFAGALACISLLTYEWQAGSLSFQMESVLKESEERIQTLERVNEEYKKANKDLFVICNKHKKLKKGQGKTLESQKQTHSNLKSTNIIIQQLKTDVKNTAGLLEKINEQDQVEKTGNKNLENIVTTGVVEVLETARKTNAINDQCAQALVEHRMLHGMIVRGLMNRINQEQEVITT